MDVMFQVALAAPDHPLVGKSEVTPADMAGVDLLLIETRCCYRELFERILNKSGVSPATTMEFGSVEAVKQCVMAGLGLTILPSFAVAAEVSQGQLCRLSWTGPEIDVMTHVVWHKDKWLSPALNAFLVLTRSLLTTTERNPKQVPVHGSDGRDLIATSFPSSFEDARKVLQKFGVTQN